MNISKSDLKSRIRIEPWSEIRGQLNNEKMLNLTYQADFLKVAAAISDNDGEVLRYYMNKGALRRPGQSQIEKWDLLPKKNFQLIIVEGYILFQELIEKRKY